MISIKQQPLTSELKKQIDECFSRYAIATVGHDGRNELVAFVAMDGNTLAGSVVVEVFWGALHIKYLIVEEDYRGQGTAKRLMEQSLAFGRENKCPFVFVETMNFQALEFYQKLGFELEFTRHGFSHGSSIHFLRKML